MSKLREAVLDSIVKEGSESDQKVYMEDVLDNGCVSGLVVELIYYRQTHDWYDTHYEEILELINEYGFSVGVDGDLKNESAWFSYEITLRKIYEEKFGVR